jgi:hypothetical protein
MKTYTLKMAVTVSNQMWSEVEGAVANGNSQ